MSAEGAGRPWRSRWGGFGRGLGEALLELLLPTRCVGCASIVGARDLLCPACAPALVAVERACRCCGAPETAGAFCGPCLRSRPPYRRARARWLYGGPLARAIRRLKYGGAAELIRPLGLLLPPLELPAGEACGARLLVLPVPLHRTQLVRRGYNQAALLAAEWVRRCPAELDYRALWRSRATRPQVGLGRAARERNVADAFSARPERVGGRNVLLIDDVITTGATAAACARAVSAAGAASVEVLALARAESPR